MITTEWLLTNQYTIHPRERSGQEEPTLEILPPFIHSSGLIAINHHFRCYLQDSHVYSFEVYRLIICYLWMNAQLFLRCICIYDPNV